MKLLQQLLDQNDEAIEVDEDVEVNFLVVDIALKANCPAECLCIPRTSDRKPSWVELEGSGYKVSLKGLQVDHHDGRNSSRRVGIIRA